ncbi:hypothetical protein [Halobacillus sp. B23F22_1]|uniref:hypothetical protein n=1 Tax=Halobacillus sp. B23F22_1 TaxID=3459514 RepID=UPI00373E3BE9
MENLLLAEQRQAGNTVDIMEGTICKNCHQSFSDSPPMYPRTCEDCQNDQLS